jgi:putative VirB-like lipoprotein
MIRMKKLLLALLALAVLAGCQSDVKSTESKSETAPKPPELLTARSAFQKLFPSARMWAADSRPFRVASEPEKESSGKDGKSAIWRASFASAARRNLKLYTWSGVHEENAPERGVTAGTEDTYNPGNSATQAFDIAFWKVDSDKAFAVAQAHGGEKLLKATPTLPVIYVLDWNPRENQLIWHVMYGGTGLETKLRVAVDASTGNFLRVEK